LGFVTTNKKVEQERSGNMQKKKAFTLIELLVVIAIIAILMAILMPALDRVKRQARNIVCRNNLSQYGLASRMYLDDFEGIFPYSFSWLYSRNYSGCRWHDKANNLTNKPEDAGSLWPYLKDKNINLCPDFDIFARMMGCRNCDGKTIPIEPQYSYSMNSYLHGDAWTYVPAQYKTKMETLQKESEVINPARVFFFSEENTWSVAGLSGASINDNNLRSTPNCTTDCFGTFHGTSVAKRDYGYANAVFVDGHVEQVSARPAGNTFLLSWPSGQPIPTGGF
jgi:prepilin-type N-terminal cleavage/methylation domain-containing protein/prepilin-type processing-associated H-X9-DG protein